MKAISTRNSQQVQVLDSQCAWNSLITGHIKSGVLHHALTLYQQLPKDDSVHLSGHTYVTLLKASTKLKDIKQGFVLHVDVAGRGLLEKDLFIGNTLIDMYAKLGLLGKAQQVFEKLSLRDVISWTALIGGYTENGHCETALECFELMKLGGIPPNAATFICSLKACGKVGAKDKGREIHDELERQGLFDKDLFVCSTLMDMYVKCGSLGIALHVFDKLHVRDVVSWTTLIAGYVDHGYAEEALNCYQQMRLEGVSPNSATLVCVLKACFNIGSIEKGREIHTDVEREGLLRDLLVVNALIDMYAKFGLLASAQEVFDTLGVHDVVSWTALIAGYIEDGQSKKALECFKQMKHEDVSPNAVTFLCSLKACSGLGATAKGIEIHSLISKQELLERDLLVGSTLVDMYAKCGSLAKAQEVFDKLSARDVVSWNALLAGYAQIGKSENVFLCFDRMIQEGIKPNSVTFITVLNTCNHLGLVNKGQEYFEAMSDTFAVVPTIDHLACMVDLLGRSGQLEKLVVTINKLPMCPDKVMWLMVLSACRKWRNVELGRWAFEQAVQLDTKDPSLYVCMGMIYADAGMQEDARKVESMRVENQAWNTSEYCSWRDSNGVVHTLTNGDGHQLEENVLAKLEDLSYQMGDQVGCHGVPHGIMEGRSNDLFCEHNEKFAVASALISTPKGTVIRLTKNVRICNDCHLAMALISKIENRKIIAEDTSRHHVFEEGRCACGDYW